MTAVHVKAIDEGNGAMALGYLERGEVQAISWNSTPEHVARNERMYPDRITLYARCPHPEDAKINKEYEDA